MSDIHKMLEAERVFWKVIYPIPLLKQGQLH